ncbi:odorant receptor 49b-like [Cylas formicarius]|uniref:odorant receptor 49b-like n=1 Tax=Cylas formicarius TaxID=197179 RepID=UPI002958D5FB|nr:odorant receptor 49b-like [Cylas formicarius]
MNQNGGYFTYMQWWMMMIGIWRIDTQDHPSYKKKFHKVYSLVIQTLASSPTLSFAIAVPGLLKTDMTTAIYNIGIIIMVGMIVVKMIMCQSKSVTKLLQLALQLDEQIRAQKEPEMQLIYRQHVKFDDKLVTLIAVSGLIMGMFVVVYGDIECYVFFKENKETNITEVPVVVNYWYPFDKKKYYTFLLIDQNVRPTLCCICIGVVSAFVNCIIIFVRLQLKLLQYSFRNFHRFPSHGVSLEAAKNTLRLLCVRHQQLIQYVEDLNESFKNILLLEYIVSGVLLAALILQITGGNQRLLVCFVLLVSVVQLLTFAWSANEIIVQSAELARALFESKWYDQNTPAKLMTQIMMMRCQKPLSLSIGPFGVMDLNVGLSRLKLGYSYTSLMTNGD